MRVRGAGRCSEGVLASRRGTYGWRARQRQIRLRKKVVQLQTPYSANAELSVFIVKPYMNRRHGCQESTKTPGSGGAHSLQLRWEWTTERIDRKNIDGL